jgi:hypothetical protein
VRHPEASAGQAIPSFLLSSVSSVSSVRDLSGDILAADYAPGCGTTGHDKASQISSVASRSLRVLRETPRRNLR